MKRWMALPVGIAAALLAGWALLSGPQPQGSPGATAGPGADSDPEPHADIDPVSRARLEAILREADRADSPSVSENADASPGADAERSR